MVIYFRVAVSFHFTLRMGLISCSYREVEKVGEKDSLMYATNSHSRGVDSHTVYTPSRDTRAQRVQGCILGGFLSYKGALLLQIWEATKPRFEPEKLLMARRPSLPDLGDEADEEEWSNRINRR